MGKSFNTGNLTNIIGYSGSNVAITGSVNISGTVVSTGTSLVSGSGQISYTGITNIPSGIVSGSAQTIANLPSGVVSGSAQTIANLPSGVVSGSAQLPTGVVSGSGQIPAILPSGVVSGSAQVTTFGFGTTGSNTFQGTQTINGSLVVTGSLTAQQFIVSSSVTYLTESFASGSHKFGDSSDDTHQFTGSVLISGSVVATGTSLISGSSQVDVMSTTNIARLATTGSNTFNGNLTNTNSNFQTFGSTSFTASTWGLSIGNGGASANYFRANDYYFQNGTGTQILQISSTGVSTFTGNLILGNNFQIDAAGDFYQKTLGAGQVSAAIANVTYPTYGFYGNTGVGMYRESADTLAFATSATKRLTISSTGAATFNGNVTVGSAIAATNVEFNLSGVSGKAKRIQFQDGVTGQWLLGQGAASETSAFELYNATGTIVLSVNKTTNISTFNGSTTFAAKTNGNNVTLSSNGTALEMYNTSGAVKNWQISSQTHNSQCMDITPSTANGGTTYSTPILTIDGEQNRVGIGTGTSRPLTLFHTYSDSDNLSTFQAGSSSGIQLRFRHGSTLTGFINSNTTNIFSVYNTNSTELVSVTPGGDVFHYGGTSNQGLWTFASVGTTTGQGNFNFDVSVGDEAGGGNIFKVEAGFAHYYGMSYNCLAEFYISTRGTSSETTDVIRRDTALAGSFTASKPNAYTLRVTKNAGTYPGGGKYWIRVTKVTY